MKLIELTRAQERYLARAAIVEQMLEIEDRIGIPLRLLLGDEESPGLDDDQMLAAGIPRAGLLGYRMAVEDLADAHRILEEEAAFGYVMAELVALTPDVTKHELQAQARSIVKHPDKCHEAAMASGVYERLAVVTS